MSQKTAFATSAYSGPLNPVIASGASFQPPRKMPQLQSAIQKVAELWPGFFNEMVKHAAEVVPGGVNVGQWWEQVGGPFLAKGGDHAEFQKMMGQAGIPANFQKKFLHVASEKYPPGHTARRAAPNAGWSAPNARGSVGGPSMNMRATMNAAATAGAIGLPLAYSALSDKTEDSHTRVPEWRGRLGSYLTGAPVAAIGHMIGGMATPGRSKGPLIGAGLGALAGVGLGELSHRGHEQSARSEGLRAARTGKSGKMLSDASQTEAKLIGDNAKAMALPAMLSLALHPHGSPTHALGFGLASIGQGMSQKRRNAAAVEHHDNALAKAAAGAPTRGNFMMASDIPAFKAPRLDRAIQKEGDMLPDGVTFNASDFKPANLMKKRAGVGKYAASSEELSTFVDGALKEADVSPAVAWSGGGGNPHRMASGIPAFRAPRLDRAIQKEGSPSSDLRQTQSVGAPKATPPPGPSIADIAKPRGAGFGTGIAGAFKTGIGGTAGVSLK